VHECEGRTDRPRYSNARLLLLRCQEYIRVLQKTLCETKLPLSIIEECLMQREKRLGIECTHDEPERTLCKVMQLLQILLQLLLLIGNFVTC